MCKYLSNNFYFANDPFSKREAWQWLIDSAESRGYINCSIRFLSKEWRWHKSKVETFLKSLKTLGLITTAIESAKTSITILHIYEEKQDSRKTAASLDHVDASNSLDQADQTEIRTVNQEIGDNSSIASDSPILSQDQDNNQIALSVDHIAVQLESQADLC
jgi:hypothetical protein